MNFYKCIHILSYIFTHIGFVRSVNNMDLKIGETGVKNVSPCVVGLKLYAVVNNTSDVEDYDVELLPDQCCLEIGSNVDCDVLQAYGNCIENLPKGASKPLTLVVPILDPYERKGYCLASLDSKTVHRKNKANTMRDPIKIPFDTRLKNNEHLPTGIRRCQSLDQDPLNKCKRVNCEVFYNGNKSFYDRKQKRCVEVPNCVSHKGDKQNSILDPVNNRCLTDEPITNDDINYIRSLKHRGEDRMIKDIVIIKTFNDGPVNVTEFYDNMHQKPSIIVQKHSLLNRSWYPSALLCTISKNKPGVTFLFFIIILQCGLICGMVYYLTKRYFCKKSTILEHKYFNYRQDASVTTPLIGVTTVETETTCQFTSESSHIDKKIQCYKACQKKNAKVSLSDDILSKCLNRRNWDHKIIRSEGVGTRLDNSKTFDTLYMSSKKGTQRVNFENSKELKTSRNDAISKSTKSESKIVKKENDINSVSECEVRHLSYKFPDSKPHLTEESEQEIKCHSYNYGMEPCVTNSLKSNSHSYSGIQSENKKSLIFTTALKDCNVSIGKQASAQASFSNDSIDDFLSERGMLFLADDNDSRYSFSDVSMKSSMTSKTSKNNILKHVLSYLKRGKHRPSSYPGSKKNEKEEVNLELIHMSKATMYSSSNNGTECTKNISKLKDSRTSL